MTLSNGLRISVRYVSNYVVAATELAMLKCFTFVRLKEIPCKRIIYVSYYFNLNSLSFIIPAFLVAPAMVMETAMKNKT